MRKFAFLKNNEVVHITSLSEEQYSELIKQYDLGIDIEDSIPCPEIGWILVGNTLENSNIEGLTQEQLFQIQCEKQRIFGTSLATKAVDKIGARNLKLAADGTPVDVAAISASLQQAKMLLDGGALKTARGLLIVISPSFPNYSDIISWAIDEISAFLSANGY